jgi:hypothetical protein
MALLEADFEKAIQGFVSAWRVSSAGTHKIESRGVHREQRNWEDVQVAARVSCILWLV